MSFANLSQALGRLQNSVDAINVKVTTLTTSNQGLVDQVADLTSSNQSLVDQVATLNSTVAELQAKIAELQDAESQAQAAADIVNASAEKLEQLGA